VNPEDALFCNRCAQALTSPGEPSPQPLSIDEKIDRIQRYLPKGLTEKVLAQRGKIEGERKQVTVMFCDMVGFTSMVENFGSEKAYSIMDKVYEILIHKVHDFEGTVNEMTGDGIMALFGAPIALEDAPQRALRSALAIHHEITKFNGQREGPDPIKMRIGVHTGPVVVGTLGNNLRVEFKAVGDTVNLASRMEGLAEPGTTFVTKDTFNLTEGLFQFETIGEREVKGKEFAVPVYRLISAKKDVHRPRIGVERSIYSAMVGRDKELNRLELQVMKAINGYGSIVNIIGEAGIGKSRLIAELKTRDVMKQVALFEGRAISTGRNLSFHPIIDLLKQWARIGEDDSGAVALSKLETAIRKVIPEEMYEVLPFVATLMGMRLSGRYAERIKGIEGEALEKLILKNMRDLISKATELKPHVIVMEDLHWADTSSIELMESLFRLAETKKIVFINVFRPGHTETGDRIVETTTERYSKQYVEIAVQPLNEQMSENLINNMLQIKGLKHVVVDQIVERADGNPFFIEEVARSFIDYGAVVLKEGVFEVTDKIENIVIPHSINDVLMARIDRLDEKTRGLVKVASVIGRSFFYRILKEMTKTIEDIDSRLSYLQEIQLFRERKRMDELEYLFKHALAQEAAYESILSDIRKEIHLKVANSIEKVFKERLHEFFGMLAYHYSKGEDFDKAEEYMIKAGEAALGSSASSEALLYYQDALKLYLDKYGETADPEKLAMLEKNIANALFYKGEHEDSLKYFDRVLERWGVKAPKNKFIMLMKFFYDLIFVILHLYFPSKKAGVVPSDKDKEFYNLCRNKDIALVTLDPMRCTVEVIATIRKILKFDLGLIDSGYVTLFSGSGVFSFSGLSFWLSKKFLVYGERLIDKKNCKELFDYCLFQTLHNSTSGNWDDNLEYDEDLINENIKIGRFADIFTYILHYVNGNIYQGEFNAAEQLLKKMFEIADSYEYEIAKGWQITFAAALYFNCRRLIDAKEAVDRSELYVNKSGEELIRLSVLGQKARIQVFSNELDEAEKSIALADEIYRKHAIVPPTFSASYLTARFLFDFRSLEQSIHSNNKSSILKFRKQVRKSGKKAIRNAKKYAGHRAEAFRLIGLYYWLNTKQNKAVKWLKRSKDEAERLGARPDLARTYMEIGKKFIEEKSKYKELNGVSAEEYLEKARIMFQEMDLQWDLDELDKIAATV
jgi:class 3 adenylate cyclase